MRELETIELIVDRFDYPVIAMPETGDRGTARSVEIMLAGTVDDVNAIALYRERYLRFCSYAEKRCSYDYLTAGVFDIRGDRKRHFPRWFRHSDFVQYRRQHRCRLNSTISAF